MTFLKTFRQTLVLISLYAVFVPNVQAGSEDRVTDLLAGTTAELQQGLKKLQGSDATCASGSASEAVHPNKESAGQVSCQTGAGLGTASGTAGEIDPAQMESAIDYARLLSVNQELLIEKQTPRQLRLSLLGEADNWMKVAQQARQADPAKGAEAASLIEDRAQFLRGLAEDPSLKEKLVAANAALAPLQWKPEWAKFRKSEGWATGALAISAMGADQLLKSNSARWKGGIGPDKSIRNALRLGSESGRKTADMSTTVAVSLLAAAPFADAAWAAYGRDSKDVGEQMFLIDLESFATSLFMTDLLKDTLGRTRPDGSDNKSFPSGHTAMAFTAAGLICTHHSYLSLYGGAKDSAACWAALAVASGVGLGRIASDKHYASDVAMGAGIGLVAGMVLPRVLHYEWKGKKTQGVIAPTIVEKSPGLSCNFVW